MSWSFSWILYLCFCFPKNVADRWSFIWFSDPNQLNYWLTSIKKLVLFQVLFRFLFVYEFVSCVCLFYFFKISSLYQLSEFWFLWYSVIYFVAIYFYLFHYAISTTTIRLLPNCQVIEIVSGRAQLEQKSTNYLHDFNAKNFAFRLHTNLYLLALYSSANHHYTVYLITVVRIALERFYENFPVCIAKRNQ